MHPLAPARCASRPVGLPQRMGRVLVGLLAAQFLACPLQAQLEESIEPESDPAYESMRLLANAIQLIRQEYVREEGTGYNDLAYSALRGLLADLDPHSQFLDPESFAEMRDDTRGEFGGIGLQIGIKEGYLTVIAPIEGSPAFDEGILPGDRILKINNRTTESLTLPEAIDLLRGKPGEKITLTMERTESGELRDVTLQRRMIKVRSVRDARLLPMAMTGGLPIGYVRIVQFSEPTADELEEELNRLEAGGMRALVLDLRHNPGGLLASAVDVCAQFLPPDSEVVSTAGRSPARSYTTSQTASRNRSMPLAILVNSSSASGAEIVAGALKDLGRALLVGETTFGKGSVQSVISLFDGSAIRLTTSEYLTPSQNRIHENGVSPHIRAVLTPAEERSLFRSRRKPDSEKQAEDFSGDPQLLRAVDALRASLSFQ